MRIYQMRFRSGAVAILVVQQPELFVTERQLDLGGWECAFSNFQRAFAHPNRFVQRVGRAQRLELIVEDDPKLFLPFHQRLPALAYLGYEIGRQLLSGKWQGLPLIRVEIIANEKTGGSG